MEALIDNVRPLELTAQNRKEELIYLVNCRRRKKLVIFGYPEEEKEDSGTLQRKITNDILENKMGVSITSLERFHRIGRKRCGSCRPVILKRFNYNEKQVILNIFRKLK